MINGDMNEDSSQLPKKQGLKNEWSLLVQSFIESSDQEKQTLYEKLHSSGLKAADLKIHTKKFSQSRKNLNLQIEKIKTEIDRLGGVVENLQLVGSDAEPILEQIEQFNIEGEKLSSEVFELEKKIKKIREIEEVITS